MYVAGHVMVFEVTENPGEEWDRFVEKHTDVLFYYSTWSRVLKEGLGGRPYYLYLKDGDRIVCGMPGVVLSYYGVKLFYCSFPYGGFIGDKAFFETFMNRFSEEAKIAALAYIMPSPDGIEEYPARFSSSSEAVTRIDLKGRTLPEVISRYAPSVRQSINKGVRLGLEVVRGHDHKSFITAHKLYLQTMQRNRGIARYPEIWFSAIQRVLAHDNRAIAYLVLHNGMPVSATVVIKSKNAYHLLHSGASTEQLPFRANDVIVCEIIKDAILENNEYLDFMKSDPMDRNMIKWKEKFGGQTVALKQYTQVNSKIINAMWAGAKKSYPFIYDIRSLFGKLGL